MKKYYIKKNIIGFIVGVILCTGTFVYAAVTFPSNEVSYDNTESGLSSTNVKGAIDELYETCTALPPGEQIIEDNNLEKDPYECRYFFTGVNPNNYITFNGEDAGWRIMSVECDGTIKIIRNEGLNHIMSWAGLYLNGVEWSGWADSPQNIYLNETYYNTLTNVAKNQIQAHDFGVETGTYKNRENMSAFIADENSVKWNGNIALHSMSEAVRMNSDTANCGTVYLHFTSGQGSATGCEKTNWIFSTNTNIWWVLSNDAGSMGAAYVLYNNGGYAVSNQSADLRPTLYLKSEVKLSGSGTQSDPYVVS